MLRKTHVTIDFDIYTNISERQYKDLDKQMNISTRLRTALNQVLIRKDNIKIIVKEEKNGNK